MKASGDDARATPRSWLALLVAAAAIGVYYQVHAHEFVNLDDTVYIVDNPNLKEGLSLAAIARDFSSVYYLNWHPLTSISYRIDHALYGFDAAGYLLTNVGLHALAAALFYLAFARMTGAPGRSAFVAALFALHPLHVESVAWASARKDVLSGVFFALTLFAYARYAEAARPRRMAIVALCFGMGLLSKSVVVTAPFVLLLLDYWPLGRLGRAGASPLPDGRKLRSAIAEKWGLFFLAGAAAVTTWRVQRGAGATSFGDTLPFGVRAANAIHSYGVYLADSVWPTGLAAFYPHAEGGLSSTETAIAGAILVGITAIVSIGAKRFPYAIVGWLWYLGMLVPMIGLVQVGQQARADRYMYLPLIGLALVVAWGAVDLAKGRSGRRALGVLGGVALLLLGARSWQQVQVWRDSRALFDHALSVTDRNFKAHVGMGDALRLDGDYAEAIAEYSAAIDLYPRWARAHLGRAASLNRMGRFGEAIESYRRSLEIDPNQPGVRGHYGVLLVQTGHVEEGMRELDRVVEEGEVNAEVLAFLADRSHAQGKHREAVSYYRDALNLDPSIDAARNNLAWLLATSRDPSVRDPAEAVVQADRIASARRSDAGALDTLAAAYAAAGRFEDATRTAERALESAPHDSPMAPGIEARIELYRSGAALYE